jgi:hypothetical protein
VRPVGAVYGEEAAHDRDHDESPPHDEPIAVSWRPGAVAVPRHAMPVDELDLGELGLCVEHHHRLSLNLTISGRVKPGRGRRGSATLVGGRLRLRSEKGGFRT